jgi:hypothetical protein
MIVEQDVKNKRPIRPIRHCELRTGLRPVPLDETGGGRLSESGRVLGLSV